MVNAGLHVRAGVHIQQVNRGAHLRKVSAASTDEQGIAHGLDRHGWVHLGERCRELARRPVVDLDLLGCPGGVRRVGVVLADQRLGGVDVLGRADEHDLAALHPCREIGEGVARQIRDLLRRQVGCLHGSLHAQPLQGLFHLCAGCNDVGVVDPLEAQAGQVGHHRERLVHRLVAQVDGDLSPHVRVHGYVDLALRRQCPNDIGHFRIDIVQADCAAADLDRDRVNHVRREGLSVQRRERGSYSE